MDVNMDLYKDFLTGLYNEQYFSKLYNHYIPMTCSCNLVMIDFEKFKMINDTFGHSVGDMYLKVFSDILKMVFTDAIVFRLHGDEFALLTSLNAKEIASCFNECDKLIEKAVIDKKIPRVFGYNAGSCEAVGDLKEATEKADYMMYYAKNHGNRYQCFDKKIWNTKLVEKQFLIDIDEHLNNRNFVYTEVPLFDKNGVEQNISQIVTKDQNGNSIFQGSQYEILRNNARTRDLDLHNIMVLTNNIELVDKNVIITVDYSSLITTNVLIGLLQELSKVPNSSKKIILSVNLRGIDNNEFNSVINAINILTDLGYRVCLSQYDSKISDDIWLNTSISHIKFDTEFLKQAMYNNKISYYLRKKVDMICNYDEKCVPIFMGVENKMEQVYLSSFKADKILFGGSLYKTEKPIVLVKK